MYPPVEFTAIEFKIQPDSPPPTPPYYIEGSLGHYGTESQPEGHLAPPSDATAGNSGCNGQDRVGRTHNRNLAPNKTKARR